MNKVGYFTQIRVELVGIVGIFVNLSIPLKPDSPCLCSCC